MYIIIHDEVTLRNLRTLATSMNNTPDNGTHIGREFEKTSLGKILSIKETAQEFFKLEAAGGIILVIAAAIALIIANTPLYEFYHQFLNDIKFGIGFHDVINDRHIEIKKSILLWINDGLMAIFFFLVGLEIKREIMAGELASRERALLPAIAAVGGMLAPAAIYAFLNYDTPENMSGWAIPAATDIAFALGVLALCGSRVPISLKVFLTAVAIIDDLGAILIIAVFYSDKIVLEALLVAGVAFLALLSLNLRGVCKVAPYILIGIILWVAVLKSGVHATLAGVMIAFMIPLKNPKDPHHSITENLEHSLHPWVAFLVLPVFAFANAGVPFGNISFPADLFDPVTLGIAAGLFFGKQIGIFLIIAIVILLGISKKPAGASWVQLYGVSLLCGIGFTMSLFIGGLAFEGIEYQASVRLGVLMGSIASAVAGYLLLRFGPGCEIKHQKVDITGGAQKVDSHHFQV